MTRNGYFPRLPRIIYADHFVVCDAFAGKYFHPFFIDLFWFCFLGMTFFSSAYPDNEGLLLGYEPRGISRKTLCFLSWPEVRGAKSISDFDCGPDRRSHDGLSLELSYQSSLPLPELSLFGRNLLRMSGDLWVSGWGLGVPSLQPLLLIPFHYSFPLVSMPSWRRKWKPAPVFLPRESCG